MGRLAGFSADEVIRKLRRAGFIFDRQAKGSHEIWWNPKPTFVLPCLTTLATYLKEQQKLFCVKLV